MRVGISGHQKIRPSQACAWVETALRDELIAQNATVGVSCLAAGADQIFAAIVLELGLELEAIIPCEDYISAFTQAESKEQYAMLSARAIYHYKLGYPEPSEEAFLRAGEHVVDSCDVMLFVWNGEPARGRGGTEEIVDYAVKKAVPYVRLNPSNQSVERFYC